MEGRHLLLLDVAWLRLGLLEARLLELEVLLALFYDSLLPGGVLARVAVHI